MKLDPIIERACTWSLNTIIWSYHNTAIIITNIKEEGRKFQNKELKEILDIISKRHLPYQQSLLTYLVYFLGACYENFKINSINEKIKVTDKVLIDHFSEKAVVNDLIKSFFDMVKRYSKDRSIGYQPCAVQVNDKKYDFNKSILDAHSPNLNKKEIENISTWFIENLMEESIQKVFIGARQYFYLENTGYMNKVAGPGKSNPTALLELKPGHFNKFKGTGLRKEVPLRMSYIHLNEWLSPFIYKNYIKESKKIIKKVEKLSAGPWLNFFSKKIDE
jgi:hypothetical protein